MKTIIKNTKKLALVTGLILASTLTSNITSASTTPANLEKDSTANAKSATIEAEVLEYLEKEETLMLEFKSLNQPTIKVFNHNDELIYEGNAKSKDDIKDKKVLALLLKSDFLMRNGNTSYYKINK